MGRPRVLHDDARGLARRDGAKRHYLAPRDDGGQNALARAPQKDEHDIGRRLLERFEKSIGRLHPEQVHAIEDVDLASALNGGERRVGHDIANLIDQVAACALRRKIAHVGVFSAHDAPAAVAGTAIPSPRAVGAFRTHDRLRKRIGRERLVRTGRACEQIRVAHPVLGHRGAQELAHLGLAEYVLERVGHVYPACEPPRCARASDRPTRERWTSSRSKNEGSRASLSAIHGNRSASSANTAAAVDDFFPLDSTTRTRAGSSWAISRNALLTRA